MSNLYKYEIIAKSGDLGIKSIFPRLSINDLGEIAFVGEFSSGGTSIFVWDGSVLKNVTPGTANNAFRRWAEAVQINNKGQIIASDRSGTGSTSVYIVDGKASDQ